MEIKGLAKVMAPDGEIRYQAVYLGYKDELESFIKQENDEMDRIMLWDLKEDIGYFDECDLEIVRLL